MPGGGVAALILTRGQYDEYHITSCTDQQIQLLGPSVWIEPRPEHYDLLVFDACGELIAHHDPCALLDLQTYPERFIVNMHALSDGRIVLRTNSKGLYILDPLSGHLEHLISVGSPDAHFASVGVLADDEVVALVWDWSREETQLWRICIQSGKHTVILDGLQLRSGLQLMPGKTHAIYMAVPCIPGSVRYESSGVVGVNLETGNARLLFQWSDIVPFDWGLSYSFLTCNMGQIYFLQPLWDEDWALVETRIKRVTPDSFVADTPWYCICEKR